MRGEGEREMCELAPLHTFVVWAVWSVGGLCGVCGVWEGAGSPLQQHRACTTCVLHPPYPGHRPQVTLSTTSPSLKCESLAAVQCRKHGSPTPRRQSVRKGDCFLPCLEAAAPAFNVGSATRCLPTHPAPPDCPRLPHHLVASPLPCHAPPRLPLKSASPRPPRRPASTLRHHPSQPAPLYRLTYATHPVPLALYRSPCSTSRARWGRGRRSAAPAA